MNNLHKKAIDQYIQNTGIIYVQNLRVCELLKYTLDVKKTTNEPTASNNKSGRPQVSIWDT